MLLQPTQGFRKPILPRIATMPEAAVRGSIPTRLIKEPEERPLGRGQSRWITPSGGIVSSLSRRAW
jgi:hypothetical protein